MPREERGQDAHDTGSERVMADELVNLDDLEPGASGEVVRIEGEGAFRRRLLEMGLIRGQRVSKVKLAPLADPAEYVIKGTHVSLRRVEARRVVVRREK